MSVLTLRAPAKLNLFLHVLGRRPDGYHELQTLFQLVDLCDDVHLESTDDGEIRRATPAPGSPLAVVPEDQDLSVRAARLLRERTGTSLGARIRIDKRIPAGGGLGGGSTDAASVLLGLARLWQVEASRETLAHWGLELGADVPVFVHGRTAWGEGRGERLTPVASPPRWYVIVHPAVHVSTAAVFADPELTRSTPPLKIADLAEAATRNDCEAVVRRRHPAVDAALTWLGGHAEARLTGTGACVFAAFDEAEHAQAVARTVPSPWQGWAVRGLERSPGS